MKNYKKILMGLVLAASVLAVPKISFAGDEVTVNSPNATIMEQQGITRYNYNGHSYALLDKNFDSIEDMEMYAESLGGHLVYINDEDENNFVAELTAKYGSKPSYALGIHRESANDTWKYFNGEEVTFTNWGYSEPNNLDTEFYVHMYRGNGKWNNTLNVAASEIAPTYRIENMGMIIEWDADFTFKGHSYSVVDNLTLGSVEEMKSYAESLGGHLVYINDEEESNFVANLSAKYGNKPSYVIGVYRENANDTWKYFNGEEVTFTNWGYSEPNNVDTEFYVHMYRGNGKWNNTLNVPASEIAPTYRIENMGMIIEWD